MKCVSFCSIDLNLTNSGFNKSMGSISYRKKCYCVCIITLWYFRFIYIYRLSCSLLFPFSGSGPGLSLRYMTSGEDIITRALWEAPYPGRLDVDIWWHHGKAVKTTNNWLSCFLCPWNEWVALFLMLTEFSGGGFSLSIYCFGQRISEFQVQ